MSIPAGWHLCDGTSGTPDLRDKFVMGAAGFAVPGATGGVSSHDHDLTSDGHTHGGTFPPPFDIAGGTNKILSTVETATTDTVGNIPNYYSLAYIMRLT